ncbi:MAG TPA: HAMP domain-containing sensor histidine kinase [Chloroflexota bacterium]|nr:HAMP domain-containing sensor histidine kinase [Chloroflexota bacterium]
MTDLVHLQLGQTRPLHTERVDFDALVQETLSMVVGAASIGSAPVHVHASSNAIVQGDRARLGRVLQNIIGNALKYSPAATPVYIDLAASDQWVTISVRDQGLGIPASDIAHVFEPFYRTSTVVGIPGSGIGLAGAKSIVEHHGGRITLESTLGVGTEVTVVLPRSPSSMVRSTRDG